MTDKKKKQSAKGIIKDGRSNSSQQNNKGKVERRTYSRDVGDSQIAREGLRKTFTTDTEPIKPPKKKK